MCLHNFVKCAPCNHTVVATEPCSTPGPACETPGDGLEDTSVNNVLSVTKPSAEGCTICKDEGERAKAEEGDVLSELDVAIASNPSLRASMPMPEAHWEGYERILAENPELAKPVVSRENEFYFSKNRWECGHESAAEVTDIEREAADDAGTNSSADVGGGNDPAILLNELNNVCKDCMDKWIKMESNGETGRGSSSHCQAGIPDLPTYDQVRADSESARGSDIFGNPSLHPGVGFLELDESPSKGKRVVAGEDESAEVDVHGQSSPHSLCSFCALEQRSDDENCEGSVDDNYSYHDDDGEGYDQGDRYGDDTRSQYILDKINADQP